MAFRMSRPIIIRGIYYLKQRVPKDLLEHLAGMKIQLPVKGRFREVTIGREFVQLSLETRDADEGKANHALADASLRRFWRRKRRELEARNGRVFPPPPTIAWSVAVERYGNGAEKALADVGMARTDANVAAAIAATAGIFDEVAAMLDPDHALAFLGQPLSSDAATENGLEATLSPVAVPLRTTVEQLWNKWREAKADARAASTLRRYKPALLSLDGFCRNRGIDSITDDDIYAWAVHRRDEDEILPRVINRNDLVAVKAVFAWATTHQGGKLLKDSPARGIRLDEPRHVPTREKSFRDKEIDAILNAALRVEMTGDNLPLARAKRWCPWLAAYSGARIGELTALNAEDVREEEGVWIMHFADTKNAHAPHCPIARASDCSRLH